MKNAVMVLALAGAAMASSSPPHQAPAPNVAVEQAPGYAPEYAAPMTYNAAPVAEPATTAPATYAEQTPRPKSDSLPGAPIYNIKPTPTPYAAAPPSDAATPVHAPGTLPSIP